MFSTTNNKDTTKAEQSNGWTCILQLISIRRKTCLYLIRLGYNIWGPSLTQQVIYPETLNHIIDFCKANIINRGEQGWRCFTKCTYLIKMQTPYEDQKLMKPWLTQNGSDNLFNASSYHETFTFIHPDIFT